MTLIPDNIVVGLNDQIPGLIGSILPEKPEELATKLPVAPIKTVYAHNVRISSMNEVEAAFNLFLKDSRLFHGESDINATQAKSFHAEITERRLTVVPHNTWRAIGSTSFVSLNREVTGVVQSSGALKILNFPLHPEVALVYKLEYRGIPSSSLFTF